MIRPLIPKIRFNYQVNRFAFYRQDLLKALLTAMFLEEGKALQELNYVFCSDEYLLEINKQFLQHDFYTDTITFNYAEKGTAVVGECYISIDRVRDNAVTHSTTFRKELLRVIIHGALHLCGYDDKDGSAEKMRQAEDKYIAKFESEIVSRGT